MFNTIIKSEGSPKSLRLNDYEKIVMTTIRNDMKKTIVQNRLIENKIITTNNRNLKRVKRVYDSFSDSEEKRSYSKVFSFIQIVILEFIWSLLYSYVPYMLLL